VGNFSLTLELIKKEREKRNLSLNDLSKKLKIPVSILEKLESDEQYVEENVPYSMFMLKSIAKELEISDLSFNSDINQEEEKKSTQTSKKTDTMQKIEENLKNKFLSFFRIVSLIVLIFTFLFLSYSFKEQPDKVSVSYNLEENNVENLKAQNLVYSKSPLVLIAKKGNIWISADIDGEKKVISLKKGQSKVVVFQKEIRFETIGNADNLTIIYNGEKISFSDKIIHNIFVDSEGIFKDIHRFP